MLRIALPETESLWYMGQTLAHRHLLKVRYKYLFFSLFIIPLSEFSPSASEAIVKEKSEFNHFKFSCFNTLGVIFIPPFNPEEASKKVPPLLARPLRGGG